MATSGMSQQFPVQISIGNVIEFASIFFESYPAKFDDGAQVDAKKIDGRAHVDDRERVDHRAQARIRAKVKSARWHDLHASH